MGIQLAINYQNIPVTYTIAAQESEVCHLRLCRPENTLQGDYLPEKIIIRRKGMLWVSDQENYQELVGSLTDEIAKFNEQVTK